MNRPILFLMVLLWLGCKPEPREIDYGLDACSYCKMNIVDAKYAAELVTKKGKIYTYDAIECLVNDLEAHPEDGVAHRLIKDFSAPDQWVEATTAVFVIHPKVQSPMGGNLAGFSVATNAQKALSIPADSLLTWEEIKSQNFVFEQ